MIYFGENKMPDFCNRQHPFHYVTALNLLAQMGIDIERVQILAIGEYENYKGEVRTQKPAAESPLTKDMEIVLEVGYPGAVDQLPFQFFYGLEGNTARGSDWDMNARHLMAPYDATVIRREAAAHYQTLKFGFGIADEDHLSRFLGLFDMAQEKEIDDLNQAVIWASILPSLHLWSGNPEKVAEVLRLLFGYRFRIVENIRSTTEIPKEIRYRLGSKAGRLGRETVIGESFSDYDSAYQVIIGGISRQKMADFIPGGVRRKKLEWVLSLCMPSNLGCSITFEVENQAAVAGKKDEGCYLGYSTHLRSERIKRQNRRRATNMAAQ